MAHKLRRIPEAIASQTRALGEVFQRWRRRGIAQKHFQAATRLNPGDELSQGISAAARNESPEAPPAPFYIVQPFGSLRPKLRAPSGDILHNTGRWKRVRESGAGRGVIAAADWSIDLAAAPACAGY